MIGLKLHVNEQSLDLGKEDDLAAVDRLFTIAEKANMVVPQE